MERLSTLLVGALLSGTVCVMSASAADDAASAPRETGQKSAAVPDAGKQEYKEMLIEASTMMGYVGIANIALLHNMTDIATANVQKGLVIARKLEEQTAQLNADTLKFGKLRYQSASGEAHDYWLPMVNDHFVINDINSEYLNSKKPEAEEEDARIVTTNVVLNIKRARSSLEKAAAAIDKKNYSDAQDALSNAQYSTFTSEKISELPLVTARDNLALAKQLAKSKNYDGASFALNHAKDALKEYQKTAKKEDSAEVAKLQSEISATQIDITKDKTSVAAVIEKRIDAWMHWVEKKV